MGLGCGLGGVRLSYGRWCQALVGGGRPLLDGVIAIVFKLIVYLLVGLVDESGTKS